MGDISKHLIGYCLWFGYFRRRFYILVVSGKVSLIKVIFFFGRSIVLTKVSLCANFYFKAPSGYVLHLIVLHPLAFILI
jgi:hypothetical protein